MDNGNGEGGGEGRGEEFEALGVPPDVAERLAQMPPEQRQEITEIAEKKQKDEEDDVLTVGSFFGPSTPWDYSDPLYSDKDRWMNTEYHLRVVPTAAGLGYLYGFMQLGDNDVAVAVRNKNLRRLVQAYPPKFVLKDVPDDKRYLEKVVHASQWQTGHIIVPSNEIFGEHNQDAVENKGSLPPEYIQRQKFISLCDQRWWAHSGISNERLTRKGTGHYKMPFWHLAGVSRDNVQTLLGPDYGVAPDLLTDQQKLDTKFVLGESHVSAARDYFVHSKGWQAFNQYQNLAEGHPFKDLARLVEFNISARFTHMYHAEGLVRGIPERSLGDIVALGPEHERLQTVTESVDVEEELLNLFSTVLKKPELRVTRTGRGLLVQVLHTEIVVFISANELNDLRKTVGHRKLWLALQRAESLDELSEKMITSAPDKWYFCSVDRQQIGDLVVLPVTEFDPSGYLEHLWELATDWANATGNDVMTWEVPPGPEVGGWHLRGLSSLIFSFKTLADMAGHVRRAGSLTGKDLHDTWFPKLVDYPKELIDWTYWSIEDDEKDSKPFVDPAPGREPHAVPHRDLSLGFDWKWVMKNDHYIFPKLVDDINEYFRECGLGIVQIGYDGPDSLYFQHHKVAELISYSYDIEELKKRLRGNWAEAVRQRKVHIRPIYQRFLEGLPQELIARLDEPDADGKKFLQELNEKSDRRVRLWAAFKSHGRKGGIRGFTIGEAVRLVEDAYGTDNGLTKEEQQGRQTDLIMLGWLSEQFEKAVRLTRGITYYFANDADAFKQLDLVTSAMGSGLHPKIANLVAKRLTDGKMLDWTMLMPSDTPGEVLYVESLFNSVEMTKLGKEEVESIIEGRMHEELEIAA